MDGCLERADAIGNGRFMVRWTSKVIKVETVDTMCLILHDCSHLPHQSKGTLTRKLTLLLD